MSDVVLKYTVEPVVVTDIRRGDTIWAPDDRDWLLVDRITTEPDEVTFYRADHSEATFRPTLHALRLLP